MENLNQKQKEVVGLTEGPVLVIAGAGTGKTKALTHRILQIIKNGVSPDNILAITFTNKAAAEMKERIWKLMMEEKLESITSEKPFISTFHAMGVHILKENAHILKIPRHFNIFDKSDSKKAIRDALVSLGLDPKRHDPGKLSSMIS
ncbi:MAG: UvrD-helicase domain-containing protein, partial [Candidatus Magasanikbacteria bacterium]|nr:UvrD-helicase domain-containing protein [Candidatus Magasanikbacteria bacterium]